MFLVLFNFVLYLCLQYNIDFVLKTKLSKY